VSCATTTGVPVSGDLPILDHSWYSIELSAESVVPEFDNKTISFMQEEDVYWSAEKGGWDWVWGRQERFHLVWPKATTKAADVLSEGPSLVVQAPGRWFGRWY
jgi:hypothetical protein